MSRLLISTDLGRRFSLFLYTRTGLIILFLVQGCLAVAPELTPGDCVLGTGMALWKLQREEGGRFLFTQFPESRDGKVIVVDDLRTYKKVDCR